MQENTLIKVNYSDELCEYWRYINNEFVLFYDNGKTETTGCINILYYLNEKNITVEIIEEEKEIEKMNALHQSVTIANHYSKENVQCIVNEFYRRIAVLVDKYNELVDEINKLKKEK